MKKRILAAGAIITGAVTSALVLISKKKTDSSKKVAENSEMLNSFLWRVKNEFDSHIERIEELSTTKNPEAELYTQLHKAMAMQLVTLYNFHRASYIDNKEVMYDEELPLYLELATEDLGNIE